MRITTPDLAHAPSPHGAPAPSGQTAIVLLGLAVSLALLALNEG